MKITYLGTAAAEGFPALFCNCEHCIEARRLGGKNIRTRSQALINEDLLIDFPADTYSHFLKNNIPGHKIKYLFVTHSHADHFYPSDLGMRHGAFAHDMDVARLKMYCNRGSAEKYIAHPYVEHFTVDMNELKAFDTVNAGEYTVTALPARHAPGDDALFYIFKGEKTLLYAHDTGCFYDEVFDYIEDSGIVFDLISLDCTNVDIPIPDDGGHMGIENIIRVVSRIEAIGASNKQTKIVINHFSHNASPLHNKLEERVKEYGYIVSYDGLSIEI